MTAPLKLAFYRPHADVWFKTPIRNLIRGIRTPNKYAAFFDACLRADVEISLVASLLPKRNLAACLSWLADCINLMAWCLSHGISPRRVRFVFRKSGLKKCHVLLLMHYPTFTHASRAIAAHGVEHAQVLSQVASRKVVHLTHYAYNADIASRNLKLLSPDWLVAENDLKKNSAFYAHYFGDLDVDFRVMPFVSAVRFEKRTAFRDRLAKMVATGSIAFPLKDECFVRFHGTDQLQPLRRQLLDHAGQYLAEMDCLVSDMAACGATPADGKRKGDAAGIIKALLRWRHPQKAYYGQDIVSIYNRYMMFVVTEELCDLPAIGFVEGMACGCAYLGRDDPMYRDLGMVPGVHYIAHDGSLEDLIAKVRHYQNNLDELEAIAERGYRFVTDRLQADVVHRTFIESLQRDPAWAGAE